MGEGGGTEGARIPALPIANSEPELSARAPAAGRPRSRTRNPGAAGALQDGRGAAAAAAAVHAAGSGLPGAGNHAGARQGSRWPHRDTDRQVSRAARVARSLPPCPGGPRSGPAAARLSVPLWTARRAGAGGGRSGCVRGAGGLLPNQAGGASARLVRPDGCASFSPLRFLGDLLCPGASTHPSSLPLGNSRDSQPWSARSWAPSSLGRGSWEPVSAHPAREPRQPPARAGELVELRLARVEPHPGASATPFSRKPQICVCV